MHLGVVALGDGPVVVMAAAALQPAPTETGRTSRGFFLAFFVPEWEQDSVGKAAADSAGTPET